MQRSSGLLTGFDDEHLNTEADDFEGWDFRHTENGVYSVGAHNEELDLFGFIAQGNPVWERRELASKSGMRLMETRKGRIDEIRETFDGAYVALVDFGEELARIDLREVLVNDLMGTGSYSTECPADMDFDQKEMTEWIDVEAQSDVPEAESTDDLSFEKIEGRGSRKEVNQFLEGGPDGTVDHDCGGVHHWKAAFVARYQGEIVAAIVLAPHQNGKISAAGEEIVISRIACHAKAPKNTSTWLIGHARDWAERDGYERISALAGVGGNRGSCYKGSGFELVADDPNYVDGNGNKWHRRRYVYELDPEKYADRDVPLPGVDYGMKTEAAA